MLHPKWLLALTLGTVLACKPDVEPDPDPDPDPVPGPLFVVSTQVFNPEGATTFVAVVPSLEEGEVDLSNAIEVPGRALAVGPELEDVVFVTDGESPEITRFDLAPDGTLQKGATVSFAGLGINSLLAFPGQFQFISDTKAYFFDGPTEQIVIWNPSEMTIVDTISLSDALGIPGGRLNFEIKPNRRGSELVVSVGYLVDNGTRVESETRVLFIDTETDEFEVASFLGCGGMLNSVVGPNGDIFLSPEGVTAALHRAAGDAAAPAPCLLRIPADSRTVENALPGSLTDLMGSVACSLVDGADGAKFLLVLDESLATPEELQNFGALRGGAFWRWQEIDLDLLAPGDLVDELPPGPNSASSFSVGGRTFTLVVAPDFSETTLVELSADNIKFGIRMTGVPFGLVQAR